MSDILRPHPDGHLIRYADQGDGTFAEVVSVGGTGSLAATDILVRQQSGAVIRYRDMGDGTFAEVISIG